MIDPGYLKTLPGLLTSMSCVLNFVSFICVMTTEEKTSIHGGFLLAVTILTLILCVAIILCHIVKKLAAKIPPYPFALFQVIAGIAACIIYVGATTFLLTEYSHIPILIASAVFCYLSGFMHLAQSIVLLKAIKVTQIAREAMAFGNSIVGNQSGSSTNGPPSSGEVVSYAKEKENVVLDPTQTVY